jgi:WD40 repeat protein/uncharacterized membrane protein
MDNTVTTAAHVNDVFISYSRKDKAFARRLDKALRDYQPPTDLPVPQRHLKVFLDEEDFTGVEYRESVGRHLKASSKLIVLCSPHARKSEFVNDEIRRFAELNELRNIIPILVSGLPNNEADAAQQDQLAFPATLCELMEMPLAIDFRGLDPTKDKVTTGAFHGPWYTTLANLYDTSRDQIEQREKKREARRRRTISSIVGGIIAVLLAALIVTLVFWRRAVEQKTIAIARQLAVQAELVKNRDVSFVEVSLLLATESMKRSPSLEADLVLRPSLALLAHPLSSMSHGDLSHLSPQQVSKIALSADRTRAATGETGTVVVWDILTGKEVRRLQPPNPVVSIAFSPDKRYLATGSGATGMYPPTPQNNAAVLWDLATGLAVGRMQHEDVVREVVFSSNGGKLAAFDGKNVQMMQAPSGAQLGLLAHTRTVLAMAFSPNAPILATSTNDGNIHLWNVDSGTEASPLRADPLATGIAFSRDGKQLALTGTVTRTLDAASGREISRARHASDAVIAFSPDGEMLAAVSGSSVILSDTTTGNEIARLSHAGSVKDLSFSPDSAYVATASDDHTARIWAVDGTEVSRLIENWALVVGFSPDGRRLVTANRRGRLRLWQITDGREVALLPLEGPVFALTADGRHIATGGGENGMVRLRETLTGREVWRIASVRDVKGFMFSPNDEKYFAIGVRGAVRIVDSMTGRDVLRLTDASDAGLDGELLFTPDATRLATSMIDKSVRIWELPSGSKVADMPHQDNVAALLFSPDGRRLATETLNTQTLFMWDSGTGGRLWQKSYKGHFLDLAFTPGGTRLAAVVRPAGTAHVWDAATGQDIATLVDKGREYVTVSSNGKDFVGTASDPATRIWAVDGGNETVLRHEGSLTSISFSADGSYIGTAIENDARIWAAATGRELARLPHRAQVLAVAFSLDRKYVTTLSRDGAARTWFLQPEDLLAEACARLTRNLTEEEWHRFVGDEPYRPTCPKLPSGHSGP